MRAPMTTYKGSSRARKIVSGRDGVRAEKVALRRIARHRDKAAIRRGNYEVVTRGQTDRDVA